jgi:hypothetical protein
MLRYDIYRNVFPVTALARWVARASGEEAA